MSVMVGKLFFSLIFTFFLVLSRPFHMTIFLSLIFIHFYMHL